MNFYTNSFIFKLLSFFIKPLISSKLRTEDLNKLESNGNIVYALASESLIDLAALNEICKQNNLPSPLENLSGIRFKRFICLKSPKYLISEQKFKRQKTHNLGIEKRDLESQKESLRQTYDNRLQELNELIERLEIEPQKASALIAFWERFKHIPINNFDSTVVLQPVDSNTFYEISAIYGNYSSIRF